MSKRKCLWKDIWNNFFSKRLLVFCIFQFTVLHYYIHPIKRFSILAEYPAAPWIFPFLGQNIYFLFVYGISVIYFYSNVPFMQSNQLYVLVRQGRVRWTVSKLTRIWLSAFLLAMVEFLLSLLPLLPRVEWVLEWGKLYYSLALTNAMTEYELNFYFSYDLINANTAIMTMLIVLLLLSLITGMVGTVMFAISILLNRTAAILVGTILAVLTVVLENMYHYYEWLVFLSPFSWVDLLLLYQKTRKMAPSLAAVTLITVVTGVIFSVITIRRMKKIDLQWTDEE